MKEELKPCPFCGSNEIETFNWIEKANVQLGYSTWCKNCKHTSGAYETFDEAAAAWNKRVES